MVSEEVAAKTAVITQDNVEKGRTPYTTPLHADLRKKHKKSDVRDNYHSYAIVPKTKEKNWMVLLKMMKLSHQQVTKMCVQEKRWISFQN